MKLQLLAACAALSLSASLGAAGAAQAAEIEIKHAVARVVVIAEARSDIAYEVKAGRSDVPALRESRGMDGRIVLDGGIGSFFIHSCSTSGMGHGGVINVMHPPAGAHVRVNGRDIALADTPLIIVHAPRNVKIRAGDAVWGNIGRADSVDLGAAGCGDWTVDDVSGRLEVDLAGSGDVHASTAGSLGAKIAGSGDVTLTRAASVDASIAGSGDVFVREVNGDIHARIAGSGDITIGGGHARALSADIAGSGDVKFGGDADRVDARIMGSGDVTVRSAKDVSKSVMGSGSVIVGK